MKEKFTLIFEAELSNDDWSDMDKSSEKQIFDKNIKEAKRYLKAKCKTGTISTDPSYLISCLFKDLGFTSNVKFKSFKNKIKPKVIKEGYNPPLKNIKTTPPPPSPPRSRVVKKTKTKPESNLKKFYDNFLNKDKNE